MSKFDFKKSAKENTTASSPVLGEKTKVTTEEVLANYNGEITIIGCDILKKDDSRFAGVLFAENENEVYFGGTVLTEVVNGWLEAFDLDAVKCSEELKESGGVKIKLTPQNSKNNRTYTKVEVLD